MYSYGSPHTAAQKQDDQHERTFSSYVRIQVVVLKTYLGRWTIGRSGERGSGISVLPARYDDDDFWTWMKLKEQMTMIQFLIWLILMVCQSVLHYFMPKGSFYIHVYIFCVVVIVLLNPKFKLIFRWNLRGTTSPTQSGLVSNGSEWVLHTPQISSFTIRCSLV